MPYKLTEIVKGLYDEHLAHRGVTALTGGSRQVEAVIVTNGGSGYTSAPAVGFTGDGGSGAAGTAIVQDGVVVAVTITNRGTGYISTPTVAFAGGGGAGAEGTALMRATALDGFATAGVTDLPMPIRVDAGDLAYLYRLQTGTDAESSPLVIQPDDYAASTNENVWKLQGLSAKYLRAESSAGINYFAGTTRFGEETGASTITLTPRIFSHRLTVDTSGQQYTPLETRMVVNPASARSGASYGGVFLNEHLTQNNSNGFGTVGAMGSARRNGDIAITGGFVGLQGGARIVATASAVTVASCARLSMKKLLRLSLAAIVCVPALTNAHAQDLSSEKPLRGTPERPAVKAAIWGMPIVNFDMMRQA